MKKSLLPIIIATAGLTLTSCQTPQGPQESDRFDAADTNHDGKLSPAEASDYFVSTVFAARDANHDGKLTWEEWNVPGSGRTKQRFDSADADKDGSVSREEAIARGRKMHLFRQEFNDADTNHDGYVSKAEAEAYHASKEGPVR